SSSLAGLLGATVTVVVARSPASIRTSPPTTLIVAVMGLGVSKVGTGGPPACSGSKFGVSGGSADPAGERLADPAAALARAVVAALSRQRRGDRPDEPGVDRQALAVGRLLDAGLEPLGETEVDAGHRAVVALGRRGRRLRLGDGLGDRRLRDDEL